MNKCPKCGSDNIDEIIDEDLEGNTQQYCICKDCNEPFGYE